MVNIDFVIPSYHSEELTSLAIKSFEKHKGDFNFRYIVVENAKDESYKENILSLAENVMWISNDCQYTALNGNMASYANAEAVEIGLQHVATDLVFVCHNDVVATHPGWMDFLYTKIQEGHSMAGTGIDNGRINATHISGLLIKSDLAKQINLYPVKNEKNEMILDVGDNWTKYCRDEGLSIYNCKNTQNGNIENLPELYTTFQVARAVDDSGNVIFLHLGRGSIKNLGVYNRPGKTTTAEWSRFINKNILGGTKTA